MVYICRHKLYCKHQCSLGATPLSKGNTVRVACFDCGSLIHKPATKFGHNVLIFIVLIILLSTSSLYFQNKKKVSNSDSRIIDWSKELPGRYQPDLEKCNLQIGQSIMFQILAYDDVNREVAWRDRNVQARKILMGKFEPETNTLSLPPLGEFKVSVSLESPITLIRKKTSTSCDTYYKAN